ADRPHRLPRVVRTRPGPGWLGRAGLPGVPPPPVRRAGVARTCQPPRLPLRLTVEQYVEAATLHRRLGRFRRRRVVNQVLDLTGLTDLRKRDASTLSSGESRRVQVGHALATGGRLLLLDEPLASLSPGDAPEVLSVLRRPRRPAPSVRTASPSRASRRTSGRPGESPTPLHVAGSWRRSRCGTTW